MLTAEQASKIVTDFQHVHKTMIKSYSSRPTLYVYFVRLIYESLVGISINKEKSEVYYKYTDEYKHFGFTQDTAKHQDVLRTIIDESDLITAISAYIKKTENSDTSRPSSCSAIFSTTIITIRAAFKLEAKVEAPLPSEKIKAKIAQTKRHIELNEIDFKRTKELASEKAIPTMILMKLDKLRPLTLQNIIKECGVKIDMDDLKYYRNPEKVAGIEACRNEMIEKQNMIDSLGITLKNLEKQLANLTAVPQTSSLATPGSPSIFLTSSSSSSSQTIDHTPPKLE